jgi:hypothetical protein
LFTGDVEVPANPHELIADESASNKHSYQENKIPRTKGMKFILLKKFKFSYSIEVKIMSIPKIAISNEDDSTLRIVETRLRSIPNLNNPSPYKSIIKTRPSQLQSPSSSTIQSFHTCIESTKDHPLHSQRNTTMVVDKNLRKNHSFTTIENANHQQLTPLRRISSYQSSSTQRFVVQDDPLILKRRSTFDNVIYPIIHFDTSSVYETPRHDQYVDNSIRLIIDKDSNMQTTFNDQSDLQMVRIINEDQPQTGVKFLIY